MNLSQVALERDHICMILKALGSFSWITSLEFTACEFTIEATKGLAGAVKQAPNLLTLIVYASNVCPDGARWIAHELAKNTTLRTLSLCANNIGSAGAKHIGKALQRNATLSTLVLSYNNLGSDGVTWILDALTANNSLTSLDVSGNNAAPDVLKCLKFDICLSEGIWLAKEE